MTLGGLVQTFQIARLKGCRTAMLQPSGTHNPMWGIGGFAGVSLRIFSNAENCTHRTQSHQSHSIVHFSIRFSPPGPGEKLSHCVVGWVERISPKSSKSEKNVTFSRDDTLTRDRVKPNAFRLSGTLGVIKLGFTAFLIVETIC